MISLTAADYKSAKKYRSNLLKRRISNPTERLAVYPTRPEGAEAPSPGQHPGYMECGLCRPVRAKAFNTYLTFLPAGNKVLK